MYKIKTTIINYKLTCLDQQEKEFKHIYEHININHQDLIQYKVLTHTGYCVKIQLFEDLNQLYLYLQGYLEALNNHINYITR